jgi:putative PIN family toxin of toxin-antitoxin system
MTLPTTSKPKLNIVPDTGFYIAAALKNGYARSYLTGRGSKFLTYELYSSEAILLETQEKLETKFGFDRLSVVKTINEMRNILTIVYPTRRLSIVRDSDDDKILECALEAKADLILAFDKDLLALREYEEIKIIHPAMLQYLFPKAFKF